MIINAIINYIIGESMEKQTWQAPEIKELSIDQTLGGVVSSSIELFTALYLATINP